MANTTLVTASNIDAEFKTWIQVDGEAGALSALEEDTDAELAKEFHTHWVQEPATYYRLENTNGGEVAEEAADRLAEVSTLEDCVKAAARYREKHLAS